MKTRTLTIVALCLGTVATLGVVVLTALTLLAVSQMAQSLLELTSLALEMEGVP